MESALRPTSEAARPTAHRRYDVLDTLPDQALDDLTALAAHICETPISLISLIDEGRQRLRSNIGLPVAETLQEISFCGHTILQPDLFVVADAAKDARFADDPLVTEGPSIRFYAGAALITLDGVVLGALCVMDRIPRDLKPSQREALRALSRQAVAQFDLRRKTWELGECEAPLLTVFHNCPVALAITRWDDGTFVDINAAFTQVLGWTREEVMGRTSLALNTIDVDASRRLRGRLESAGTLRDLEVTVRTRAGEARQVLVGMELLDLRGEQHVVSTFADITPRKRAEEERGASEARYQTLFDCAPDGIAILDANDCYVDANASMCRMLGYPREELIGLGASSIVESAEQEHTEPGLSATRHAGYHRTYHFRRKDASRFPADVIATLMPNGHLLEMIRDTTEQNRTAARFRRLVDSNAQGVMFWNANGGVTGSNDAFLRMVGYTRDDLEAGLIRWKTMTPPEYTGADLRSMDEIATNGVCTPYEKEYIRKDGSRVSILLGAAAFEDEPGEGVSFVLDLTEKKNLEKQFLRAQRMESIGTVAGGIAHDLNNVLAPILLSIELLKDEITDTTLVAYLDTVQESARRGAALVRQVLSFASGGDGGHPIPLNPLQFMRDLLKVMQETFPKAIDVRFTAADDLWSVTADPIQMHQVFLNLCVNARDAMPGGGALTLSIQNIVLDDTYAAMHIDSRPGEFVVVTLVDSGSGMPPQVRERIFEPFFTTKGIGEGTGLGLSTSLGIVKSHRGFIHVHSEVGKGTTFRVYLPAHHSDIAADQVTTGPVQLPRGNGELILVVDDEEPIRNIARATLERFGYRVLLAANGAEAVVQYAQCGSEIAAVLIDMAMPVMNGASAIAALRAMNPAVKIIGSSGVASEGGIALAVGSGVQHYAPKPYTAEMILRTLNVLLSESDTRDSDLADGVAPSARTDEGTLGALGMSAGVRLSPDAVGLRPPGLRDTLYGRDRSGSLGSGNGP